MTDATTAALDVLVAAGAQAHLDTAGAQPIRLGENALFLLPGQVVARVARPGQHRAAHREIQIARWLAEQQVPAVHPVDGVPQPIVINDQPVTFWNELPTHRSGTSVEVAQALRCLHSLAVPTGFTLESLDPFVRIEQRIDNATILTENDQAWLRNRLTYLRQHYTDNLPAGLPQCVVHGDASDTNIAVDNNGTITLLDLERCTIGPPEWDLTSMAVELGYQWITSVTYQQFCDHYGYDVRTWAGYPLLRDIRELRMTSWLAQQATEQPQYRTEAVYRLQCLQGKHGPRPWTWTPA